MQQFKDKKAKSKDRLITTGKNCYNKNNPKTNRKTGIIKLGKQK